MSQKNFSKLNETELEYVDDKTAALLLNTPTSARIMLWVIVLFFIAAIAWSAWARSTKLPLAKAK